MNEYVRCQECGGTVNHRPPVNDGPFMESDGYNHCNACGNGYTADSWNRLNARTRARKRFELVVAMAGGWMASPDNDDDTSTMRNRARGLAYCADAILNEMYGEVRAVGAEVEE